MKASEVLRAAIPLIGTTHIYDGQIKVRVTGICHALNLAADLQPEASSASAGSAAERAKRVIMRRLYPDAYLTTWLRRRGISDHDLRTREGEPTEALINHRKQWAEMLAQEFEAQGD